MRESLEVVASIIGHHAGMSSVLVPWAGYPEHANRSRELWLAEVWAGLSLVLNPGQIRRWLWKECVSAAEG